MVTVATPDRVILSMGCSGMSPPDKIGIKVEWISEDPVFPPKGRDIDGLNTPREIFFIANFCCFHFFSVAFSRSITPS